MAESEGIAPEQIGLLHVVTLAEPAKQMESAAVVVRCDHEDEERRVGNKGHCLHARHNGGYGLWRWRGDVCELDDEKRAHKK